MFSKKDYERLKRKLTVSPYKYGQCWKLCGGVCCGEPESGEMEYYLEFFPFENRHVSRKMFPRFNKYQVKCNYSANGPYSCGKTLYCYLAPSHPAFEGGIPIGVIIDPEFEACPLAQNQNKVSMKFMKTAFEVWKEILGLLPKERVTHYNKQYRSFVDTKKVKKVWRFG